MKLFVIFSINLFLFESAFSYSRIVGGQDANIEDFPYMVSIKHNGEHICTGGKFAGSYVFTVAQCVIGLNPGNVTVRSGSSFRNSGGSLHQVVNITLDHRYNPRNLDYDIAILQIGSESSFLKLPDKSYSLPEDNTFGNITGWGRRQTGGPLSEVLQVIEVPIVNFKVCQYNYKKLTQRMFCAGYMSGLKGACVGDIGAPFHSNGIAYGFFSWSYGCSEPNYPGVFTNFQETIEFVKNIVHINN